CRLIAVTSVSEGGPSVIAEAIVAGTPVIATRVSGCVGMLGDDYPGLFAPGDTQALAELLGRTERVASLYNSLRAACDRRRPIFQPQTERATWQGCPGGARNGPRPRQDVEFSVSHFPSRRPPVTQRSYGIALALGGVCLGPAFADPLKSPETRREDRVDTIH